MIAAYFEFDQHVESHCPESLLSWVHVHSEVHKLDLASIIGRMQRLELLLNSESDDALASATHSLVSFREEDLGEFLIERSYESLKCIIHDVRSRKKPSSYLKQWYIVYHGIVSIIIAFVYVFMFILKFQIQVPTLYDSMHMVHNPKKKVLLLMAHVVYLIIHCHDLLTDGVIKEAISFYFENLKEVHYHVSFLIIVYVKFLQMSTEGYSVQDVVNCVSVLKKYDSSFFSSFMQNLLQFVLQNPCTQTCLWFLQAASSVPPQTIQLLNYIPPNLYKHYLLHILDIHDGTEDDDDLLELFQPTVYICKLYI